MSKKDATEVKITQAMFNQHMKKMFLEILEPIQSCIETLADDVSRHQSAMSSRIEKLEGKFSSVLTNAQIGKAFKYAMKLESDHGGLCTCDPEYPDSRKQCEVHGKPEPECFCTITERMNNPGTHTPRCPRFKHKPEPECTCPPEFATSSLSCPKHGMFKKPSLPLHVRVAKALDYHVFDPVPDRKWRMQSKSGGISIPIPDYPRDRDAAIGALEEYCEKHHRQFCIFTNKPKLGMKYSVSIGEQGSGIPSVAAESNDSLPEAICHAIVNHAEGK